MDRPPSIHGDRTLSNEPPDAHSTIALYHYLLGGLAVLMEDELRLTIAYIIKVALVKTIKKLIIAFTPLKKLTLH